MGFWRMATVRISSPTFVASSWLHTGPLRCNHKFVNIYVHWHISTYIYIHIYIYTENNTLQARVFRLSVSHCEQRFYKNLIYTSGKEIFVRPTKIHAVYSMEPIIQRMQTELKASAGNMARARSAYRAKKRKPKSRNQRILVGGGAKKKIKGRPVSVFFCFFSFFLPPPPPRPREPGTSKPSPLSLEPGLWIGSLSLGNVYLLEALERPRNRITNKPGLKTKEEHTQKCASMSFTPIASAY